MEHKVNIWNKGLLPSVYPQLSDESLVGQDERFVEMYAILCALGLTAALVLAAGTILHMFEHYAGKMRAALRGEHRPVPGAPESYDRVRVQRSQIASRASLSPIHRAVRAA